MTELKPCPFCGENGSVTFNTVNGFVPFCTNDNCLLNELDIGFDTEGEAVEAWNRRASDEQIH